MKEFFTGSICLSDIPENLIKYVKCKDGKVRAYVNVALMPMREPKTFKNGDRTTIHTHFLTCAPRKEDRVDGVNYIIGNLKERGGESANPVDNINAPKGEETAPQQAEC